MARELLAVGLSHHTAPVEVRERMAMDEPMVRDRLDRLRREGAVSEAMLLSTCNRVELYAVPEDERAIHEFLREQRGPGGEPIDKYLYWHKDVAAVRHLFSVASSLDSLVLGEPQILGQVKTAIRIATEARSIGRTLDKLTRQTMSVAKRVRTETRIGESRVGIGNAGVDLALQIFGELTGKRALLIGVGEMGCQVARAMVGAGIEELVVCNRTFERSVEVAAEFNGTPITWDKMQEYLAQVDVVITATGAPKPILTAEHIGKALRARRWRSLFLVDLAVPRNIASDVSNFDEAYLFNVDDLTQVMDEGQREREAAAEEARTLVEGEAQRFMAKLAEIDIGAHIGVITRHAEQIRMDELDRSGRLLESLDENQRKAVDAMTRAMFKKLLHSQIQAVRNAALSGDEASVDALLRPWTPAPTEREK